VQSTGKAPETASEDVAAKLKEQAPKFTLERLARIAKRLLETEQQLRVSEGTPLPLELAILDLVTSASTPAPSGQPSPTQPTRATSTTPSRPTTASSRPAMSAPTPMRTGPRAEASVATSDRSPATVVDLAARRAAASLAIEDVRKAWAELVAEAKAQSLGKAAHLNDAEPMSIEGSTIVIGFATDFARAFWQDRLRAELERGLSERLSVAVRVRCVVQPLPAGSPDAQDDPMHRAALEIFRRSDRIMEIE
jgi:DNA polymerase III gamma/tau subunit